MKTHNMSKIARLWLLFATLITPITGIAEQPDITVDAVIPQGRFVMFYLRNFEDRAFFCSYIRVQATVKDSEGNVVARRSIIARDVLLPAGSLKKQVEAGKESIKELENEFDEPRIVDISDPKYRCKTIVYVTVDKKVFRDVLKDGSLGPEMVWIPAGRFRMGDIQGDGENNEEPVHWVSVDKCAMGRYEVTFAEYDKFAKATNRKKPDDEGWGRGNRPVINVSWYDAVAYTEWLSQQTGEQYRLPTEAEWEYAARAGTETKYWWGNTASHEYANYGKDNCCGGLAKGKDRWKYTSPVGSFEPNPFGLYDTVGNVWEWICSEYENKYKGKEKLCLSKSHASYRVLRGGSWVLTPSLTRAADRSRDNPDDRSSLNGFRLVRRLAARIF
jgi:formylglycine-generating enzyme required for sulfatase activity